VVKVHTERAKHRVVSGNDEYVLAIGKGQNRYRARASGSVKNLFFRQPCLGFAKYGIVTPQA
jgi:hypothetical protein